MVSCPVVVDFNCRGDNFSCCAVDSCFVVVVATRSRLQYRFDRQSRYEAGCHRAEDEAAWAMTEKL